MDDRLMPLAVFRCDVCGEQKAVTLDLFTRRVGEPDVCKPWPHHDGQKMSLLQVDYLGRA